MARTYKQGAGMLTQSLGEDEIMVVPTEGENVDRVLTLNGSGGFVWSLLEKERTFDEIVALLTGEYDIPAPTAREDLAEFLGSIRSYITIVE